MYEMAKIRMYFRNQRLNLCYFFQLYGQNENGGAKLSFCFKIRNHQQFSIGKVPFLNG
jgi:hypothetical protein